MKVVIDTNVFVSGVFWKGPPHLVLEAWADERYQLVASLSILEEYRRVLGELSAKYPNVNYQRMLELVSLHASWHNRR